MIIRKSAGELEKMRRSGRILAATIDRVLAAVEQKVEGHAVTSLAPQAQRTQVIDLMEALKQSLGTRTSGAGGKAAAGGARGADALEKKPAAKARREKAEPAPREKKVQGGRR